MIRRDISSGSGKYRLELGVGKKARDRESRHTGRNQSHEDDESHWGQRAREPQYLRRRQGKKSQQRKLGTNSRGGRKSRWEQFAGRWGLPKGSDATEEEYGEDIKQAFGFLIGRSLEVQ